VSSTRPAPHRIRRRTLELRVGDAAGAAEWRNQARGLWDEALAPALERVLDDFSPADGRVWRVPRIEVELHLKADTPWTEVESAFAALLQEQLAGLRRDAAVGSALRRESTQESDGSEIAPGRRAREWISHWLRQGTLPWWAGSPNARETAEALLEVLRSASLASGAGWLAELLQRFPAAAFRLAHHLPREFQPQLLAAAKFGEGNEDVPALLAEWLRVWSQANDTREAERVIWEATWLVWARRGTVPREWPATVERMARAIKSTSPATLRERLRVHIAADESARPRLNSPAGSATVSPSSSRPTKAPATPQGPPGDSADSAALAALAASEQTNEPPTPDGLTGEDAVFTVNDAGLVLLAPYLAGFFAALGCDRVLVRRTGGDDEPKTFPPEAGRLVCLLHYLATGATEAFEPELLLPKLLCGLPPEWPVPASIELTELEKTEATNLLTSVVEHWTALGKTTPEGLRSSFLSRTGTLSPFDEGWKLRVENRGWDVLVERIPWTFRMVKLSWMAKPIWVEWNGSR
jgi:Contractile injection system tape measure protein